jgi:hypothetical protein
MEKFRENGEAQHLEIELGRALLIYSSNNSSNIIIVL